MAQSRASYTANYAIKSLSDTKCRSHFVYPICRTNDFRCMATVTTDAYFQRNGILSEQWKEG